MKETGGNCDLELNSRQTSRMGCEAEPQEGDVKMSAKDEVSPYLIQCSWRPRVYSRGENQRVRDRNEITRNMMC
jgi:hypothetical protein